MPMREWVQIAQAAGFQCEQLNAMDVHQLAARIMRDDFVQKRRHALRVGVFIGDLVEALDSMTAIEKTELRKRIHVTASA